MHFVFMSNGTRLEIFIEIKISKPLIRSDDELFSQQKILLNISIFLLLCSSKPGFGAINTKVMTLASLGILTSSAGMYFSIERIKQPLYLDGLCVTDDLSLDLHELEHPLTSTDSYCKQEAIGNRTTIFEYLGPAAAKPQIDDFFATFENKVDWFRSTYCSEVDNSREHCQVPECINSLEAELGLHECFLDLRKIKETNEIQLRESLTYQKPHGRGEWTTLSIGSAITGIISVYILCKGIKYRCSESPPKPTRKIRSKKTSRFLTSYLNYYTFSGQQCTYCNQTIESNQMIHTCENNHPLHKSCHQNIENHLVKCPACLAGGITRI
ncbi:MAG: hypothetical protein AB8G05_20845 [Oligoflexales bacterium]